MKARKYWLSGEGMAELEIKAGDKFFVPWPFSYTYDHKQNTLALVPGFASIDREDGVVIDMLYNVEGRSILTVIAVFKPPGYQTRIFYTRHYEVDNAPGQLFGTGQLRIKTLSTFKRILIPDYLQKHRKATEQETLKVIAEIKAAIARGPEEPRPFYEDDEIPF